MSRISIEPFTRQTVKADLDRLFLIRFIANPAFAVAAAPHLKIECFAAAPARRILGWCKEYTTLNGGAIGKGIQTAYTSWVERENPSEDEATETRDLLESLSEQADEQAAVPDNPAYLIKEFREFTDRRYMSRVKEQIELGEQTGNYEPAFEAVNKFRQSPNTQRRRWNILSTNGPLSRAFAEPVEPIIEWPKPADVFLGRACVRGGFIGIQAPEKRGKTFLCLEFLYRALMSKRKVAYFTCGDLTEEEVNLRWYTRICSKPLYEGDVSYPQSFRLKREGSIVVPEVELETQTLRALRPTDVPKKMRAFHVGAGLSPDKNYTLFAEFSNSTATFAEIDSILRIERDTSGFIPDVIICDYIDIFAPEPGSHKEDFRNRCDVSWKAGRRLAQEWRALLVTPTQADSEAYDTATQRQRNFGNDKRKNGHATGILCINQTNEEKEQQIARLNWTFGRGFKFNEKHCLYVTQCFELGIFLRHCALPPKFD